MVSRFGLKTVFFSDQQADFNMSKKNFPENTLVYEPRYLSTIKSDLAIYTNFFILGQVILALNSPKGIDSYQRKQNETKIIVLLYNVSTGFLGLDLQLGYIVLRGDSDEIFFSYEFNAETSKVLFCSSKDRIPNAFTCTVLKKHYKMIVDERLQRKCQTFFLPSFYN